MTRSTRLVRLALVAGLVLLPFGLGACSQTRSSLATVNGVAIPASQVDQQLAQVARQQPTAPTASEAQQDRALILANLIQAEVIRQQCVKVGIDVTGQVDAGLRQLAAQYGGETKLTALLKQRRMSLEQVRASIRSTALATALMAKATPTSSAGVNSAQVANYYAANRQADFTVPAQVHLAQILVSTTDTVLARNIVARLRSGADFSMLARRYSKDRLSAKAGGDLGWGAATNYPEPVGLAAPKMKVGSLEMVRSQLGWHIIKLLGTRSARVTPLSTVTEQIRQTLASQAQTIAFSYYVANLKKRADIVVFDPTLKKIIDALPPSSTQPVLAP